MLNLGIISSQVSNLSSIKNAIDKLGFDFDFVDNANDLHSYKKLILPGVGSASAMMSDLKNKNLLESLKEFLLEAKNNKKSFLGICLGLQILFKKSEEKNTKCINFFDDNIFHFKKTKKVPHMGWSKIVESKQNPIMDKISKNANFYFVHSFFAKVNKNFTSHFCDYDEEKFSAIIQKGNVFACQFHPEKSGEDGLMFLKNFCNY